MENGSWEKGAPGLREKGWRDVGAMMSLGSKAELERQKGEKALRDQEYPETKAAATPGNTQGKGPGKEKRPIFSNLTIYINGSTAPMISDHKLKQLLAEHGARLSIALGRRTVTHVIVGRPNGVEGGAGGGLSGSKIQKEIQRVRGCGIKFVSVEWVLESVKAGKRLGEAQFEGVKTAPRGVGSVYGMLKKGTKADGGITEGAAKDVG